MSTSLSRVQDVLGLDEASRQRMKDEGIETVEHLFDIADLLQEGRVTSLRAIETAKLLHVLEWQAEYPSYSNGSKANVAAFSSEAYEAFLVRKRGARNTYVWPFLGIFALDHEQKREDMSDARRGALEQHETTTTKKSQLAMSARNNSILASGKSDGDQVTFDAHPQDDDLTPQEGGQKEEQPKDDDEHKVEDTAEENVIVVEEGKEEPATITEEVEEDDSKIHEHFIEAEEYHQMFHASGLTNFLEKAIHKYRFAAMEATALSVEDCLLQSFACVKLGILLAREEFKNDHASVQAFKKAAVQYKMPAGLYFYGFALVHGQGGEQRDVSRGIGMLNEAAAAGISESYFQLGSIYEMGIEGSLPKDIETARSYYEATCKAYVDEEGNKRQEMWTTVVMGMRQLIPSKSTHHGQPLGNNVTTDLRVWTPEIRAVKHLIPMDDWDTTEGYLVNVVGERFNWGLAGQAFLFGASVVMTQTPQAHHYPTLLPTLPVLGMTLAAFSMLQMTEIIIRNKRRRVPQNAMLSAKLNAFARILHVGKYHIILIPPLHHIWLLFYKGQLLFLNCFDRIGGCGSRVSHRSKTDVIDAKIKWLSTWASVYTLQVLAWWIEVVVFLVTVVFFVAWFTLLVVEIESVKDDCSNWFRNTCQGSNVDCNLQDAMAECPAL